MIGMIEIIN